MVECCTQEIQIATMQQTVNHHGNALERLDTKVDTVQDQAAMRHGDAVQRLDAKIDTVFSHKESKCDKILEQINQDDLKAQITLLNHTIHECCKQMEKSMPDMQKQIAANDRRFSDYRLSTEKRLTKIITIGSVCITIATLTAIVVPHFLK